LVTLREYFNETASWLLLPAPLLLSKSKKTVKVARVAEPSCPFGSKRKISLALLVKSKTLRKGKIIFRRCQGMARLHECQMYVLVVPYRLLYINNSKLSA
jgi:hypothetical protein